MREEVNAVVQALTEVRRNRPLIHQITNVVTVNDCANMTLAIGASPVMAWAAAEVAEVTACARALVLNTGTLQPEVLLAMHKAGERAAALSIPIVLDPVGVGASVARTQAVEGLLQKLPVAIIRGNQAEIKRLVGQSAKQQGVDSLCQQYGAEQAAVLLAKKHTCVVAMTGEEDFLTDGSCGFRLMNGHAYLASLTGTGCMTSALVASLAAVTNPFIATIAGVAVMGIAGEIAYAHLDWQNGEGLGSFRVRLLDAVSRMDGQLVQERLQMQPAVLS